MLASFSFNMHVFFVLFIYIFENVSYVGNDMLDFIFLIKQMTAFNCIIILLLFIIHSPRWCIYKCVTFNIFIITQENNWKVIKMLMMWLEIFDFGESPKLIDFQLVKIYYLTFKHKKIDRARNLHIYIQSSEKYIHQFISWKVHKKVGKQVSYE